MKIRAALLAVALAAGLAWSQDSTETLHGVAIADPYRHLEDASRPETQAFFRGEDAKARTALERLPGRAPLAARIRELSAGGVVITDLKLEAGKVFYLRRAPGQASAALCMRDGLSSPERVLVDPERLTSDGKRVAIDWYVPAPDAKHVAYGVSFAGSEDSRLHILSLGAGRDLAETIDRARFNRDLGWDPDGHAFYYARYPEGAGAKRFANVRIYRHVLGRSAAQDEVVFAPGVGGARDVPEHAYPHIVLPLESRHAYAVVREGARNEIAVHITEQKQLAIARPQWRKIVSVEDEVTAIAAWKNDLFLLSHRGAEHFRVLRLDASNPAIARAKVAIPEGDSVIQEMALAHDGLYLRTSVAGEDRLERLPFGLLGTKRAEFLKTSFDMGISQLVTHPRRPGALLRMEGRIEAPVIFEVDAKSGDLRKTSLQPPSKADLSQLFEVRLYAPAEDGTRIPVTLVYRKTTQLDARNPTLLVGYGSHGITMRATFEPTLLAWIERGGVYAVAHGRGGGEYGKRWHDAGRKATKGTSIKDFIAVADFLVKYGFTNPQRLAIEGTEAGGILVGGAIARRPELFAAAILRMPLVDMLRAELMPGGPANIPEFGTVATRAGFDALLAMSAYHQVKDAMPYPAVLLSTSRNDPRVEAWQAGKMAARLQSATTSAKPVLMRVDSSAGGLGATRVQLDEELADLYSFLFWQLGDPDFQPREATQ